ncbi:hypothetical protein [Sebaldella sp. S0638]|uniref:hypothetical protein n=1 Tax=Sebaldella sp. S0638 TaxID=2957809 RepID=UPI00209D7921|nr:hypothetical protein [Sebaldella sp. S0638]MCP1224970.1 hypothetical protein [Sebaldella sp. S0638]
MKKLFFLMFIFFGFCINAENFLSYKEVSEPEYLLIYEANGLFLQDDNKGISVEVENGNYKFVDNAQIVYLTMKNSVFDGKIYVYDKKTNKRLSVYSFKNGVEDGKWIEYDKNEKPASIDYIKNGLIMKRETYVNGQLVLTRTFKNGITVNP